MDLESLSVRVGVLVEKGLDRDTIAQVLGISPATVEELGGARLPAKVSHPPEQSVEDQCKDALLHFALGGRGNPDQQLKALQTFLKHENDTRKLDIGAAFAKNPIDNRKVVINFNSKLQSSGRPEGLKNLPMLPTVDLPKVFKKLE